MTVTTQKIVPFLMFSGNADEAMNLYISLFSESAVVAVSRYGAEGPGSEGAVQHATFMLHGQTFMCIDSAVTHAFSFTPAISLYVHCADEAELDRLFAELSKDGAVLMPPNNYGFSVKFTWVTDRFGVSWQLNVAT